MSFMILLFNIFILKKKIKLSYLALYLGEICFIQGLFIQITYLMLLWKNAFTFLAYYLLTYKSQRIFIDKYINNYARVYKITKDLNYEIGISDLFKISEELKIDTLFQNKYEFLFDMLYKTVSINRTNNYMHDNLNKYRDLNW